MRKLCLAIAALLGVLLVPVGVSSASVGPMTCVPGTKHGTAEVRITGDLRQYPAYDAPRGCGGVFGPDHWYNADCFEEDATGNNSLWIRLQGASSLWGFFPAGNLVAWSGDVHWCR
ncbi:hypothetical protein ACFQ1S_32685 [Kibdelosporangium lantanae]|uniref:Secreted protein n=1 Tax=Kibdelosporangium lantanae TaxID=1497396 RepID=A0ABW3MH49_9PSEU